MMIKLKDFRETTSAPPFCKRIGYIHAGVYIRAINSLYTRQFKPMKFREKWLLYLLNNIK